MVSVSFLADQWGYLVGDPIRICQTGHCKPCISLIISCLLPCYFLKRASFGSFMAILQHTFAHYDGLSRPGCWGHLDMLEVGCRDGPNGNEDVGLSFAETRTHFAAWAIMSSPLF